jgi:GT2 family glycosyltransferase
MTPRVSVVIVTWNERDVISRCLPPLVDQLGPEDELIVSDNGSIDGTRELVRELAPQAIVVDNGANLGFMDGCNRGAERASKELLVLLNPDTVVAPGWADAMRLPAQDGRGWEAWQSLVTMEGGTRINTSGGVVHFTGIAWAGGMGEPCEAGAVERGEVGFVSGAAMAIPLETWRRLDGMPGYFFLYCDDVDISLRLRLTGGRIGVEPAALVDHDYEFSRRGVKWRVLERNRWATVLRTYPGPLLALVMPALLAAELGILAVAVGSGWGGQKLLAMGDTLRRLPRVLRERRQIQRGRTVSSAEFASRLTADLTSPYLGPVARALPLRLALRAYWAVVTALLRTFG